MLSRLTFTAVAALLAASPAVGALTSPAEAASAEAASGTKYASCDALHKQFKHGVARSSAAANKQVRNGYTRPSTTARAKAVYRANSANLDRDKDGTACEV